MRVVERATENAIFPGGEEVKRVERPENVLFIVRRFRSHISLVNVDAFQGCASLGVDSTEGELLCCATGYGSEKRKACDR
jgi:hypothetical protein